MFEEVLPQKRIGYIYPRHNVDSLAYELYRVLPDRVMVVFCPISLKGFEPQEVERALAPLDTYLKALMGRYCDIIVHGGVPLDLVQGIKKHDELLARIAKTTGVLATSTIQTVVTATKQMGIKKVALANKWSSEMNRSMEQFFTREGIAVVGTKCASLSLAEIESMKISDNTNLIYRLGREALQEFRDADGVYIAGGSMVSFPIVEPLEKEFGKPVILNVGALSWTLCHQLNFWTPIQGKGRLLGSP